MFLYSFWVSSFHSHTLLQATLALSLIHIFVEIGMLWHVHILYSDDAIACPQFNLVRNFFVHSPSSVIRVPWYGMVWYVMYSPVSVAHSGWVCGTLCRHSQLPWSCWHRWVGCIYGWLGLGNPPTPVVLPSKLPTGWCYQHSDGSWVVALLLVVHVEIVCLPHHHNTISARMLNKYGERTTLSDFFLNTRPFW